MTTSPLLIDAVRSLARASRIMERAAAGQPDGLSLADYRVLSAIVAGEGRASRLADRLALGKPTISASIESLSRRGLVNRSAVDGDNRAIALSLSESGAALFERVEARMAHELEALCGRTPEGEDIVGSLAALGEVIEAVMAARTAEKSRP